MFFLAATDASRRFVKPPASVAADPARGEEEEEGASPTGADDVQSPMICYGALAGPESIRWGG